ncbi:IS3 family transposase [Streptomyces sp. NPDC002533]
MGKKKPSPRRSFTPEFKAEIVELCRSDDRSVGQIAKLSARRRPCDGAPVRRGREARRSQRQARVNCCRSPEPLPRPPQWRARFTAGPRCRAHREDHASPRETPGTCRASRLHAVLQRQGEYGGRRRIARLMRAAGLCSQHHRRRHRRRSPTCGPPLGPTSSSATLLPVWTASTSDGAAVDDRDLSYGRDPGCC